MDFLPQALDGLKEFPQFIIYRVSPSKNRPGKNDKFPMNWKTGKLENAHSPEIWTTFELAMNAAKLYGNDYGVGYVLTAKDPFWFLDIDDCLSEKGMRPNALAISLIKEFEGAAIEVSNSLKGLHIIGSGKVPPHSCRDAKLNIEFYTQNRFIALTGLNCSGSVNLDFTMRMPKFIDTYFKFSPTSKSNNFYDDWTTEPTKEWNGPENDDELIERMLKSQPSDWSPFGNKARFCDLWNKNIEVLSKAFPPNTNDSQSSFNESNADAALAQHLAFWTGKNSDRMRRLMLRSALRREKWDRHDYLPRTFSAALGRQTEVLNLSPKDKTLQTTMPQNIQGDLNTLSTVNNTRFLSIPQQAEFFKGCVYICDQHEILVPGGYTLDQQRFRVMYGGFSMPMDGANEKCKTNAWEVFTESQALNSQKVQSATFRPDLPPATIIIRDQEKLVNSYWPITTRRLLGDATPFLNHVEKLFPDKNDQLIILSYMAGIVQFKGVKFQWGPLIQGVQGNGKTLLTRCVAFAIGNRYCHFPSAFDIANKFNDWQYKKIFIGVEDIYIKDSEKEVIEILKPMMTGNSLEMQGKGTSKIMREICCNYILNTNHKNGLRKTRDDRRFAPFFTAQQDVRDLKRDGMLGDYFGKLYGWLYNQDGFAIVNDFLHNFLIPEQYGYNCLISRAPETSSTEQAISHGLGGIEQEILETISEGVLQGFKGGWVSSKALERLLDKLKATRYIPVNKRRDLMRSLGYDWHPGLKEGRVNNPIPLDGGKPRLYIKDNHEDLNLIGSSQIAKAYVEAQKNE